MDVHIKRIDKTLPLPRYESEGAVAFDLYSRETIEISGKSLALLPSNLIIGVPDGYALQIFARSSLAKKKGLMLANSVGIIDADYCGEEDEILISVYNFRDEPVTVERGTRIAQGMFVPAPKAHWIEVELMHPESRGGFGSTGS